MTFYLLLLIYPVSVGSVVVFIGSWSVSYAGWSTGVWIWITLAAIAVGTPVLLRGTGVSVKTAFIMFLTEAVVLPSTAVLSQGSPRNSWPERFRQPKVGAEAGPEVGDLVNPVTSHGDH